MTLSGEHSEIDFELAVKLLFCGYNFYLTLSNLSISPLTENKNVWRYI